MDFNRRESERCGSRWTSTGEGRSAVGLPDFNRTSTATKQSHIECQRECHIECHKIFPDRMPDRMSEDMPDRMSEDMPDRMSEDMPDRM